MAESLHEMIDRERKAADAVPERLRLYRRYVAGDHDWTLSTDQRQMILPIARHKYADNVADMILAAWSSRLTLTGFAVESDGVQAFLDDFFTRNALGDLSYDVNYATGRDGNHALMLRWLPDDQADAPPPDPEVETSDAPTPGVGGRVTVHTEDWWDGKTGIWVAYDDFGRPAYAVKDFPVMLPNGAGAAVQRMRRTVYFPDKIMRFIEAGRGWQPYTLAGEPGPIVPWVKADGAPLGLPVVHFSFPRFGLRPYGVSELAGGLLANQDQLNALQMDLSAAARLLGFQIITLVGDTFQTAPKLEPGTMLQTGKEGASFGTILPGDLKQLIDAHGLKLQTVARMTATPIHIITGGDWPAGVALVQAEKPLIAKVMRLASVIGPAWTTLAHRATEMANAFGAAGLDETSLITARFADPEQLDQLAQAQVDLAQAQAQAAIELLNDKESLMALGMSEAEAQARLDAREKQAQAKLEAMTGFVAAQANSNDQSGDQAAKPQGAIG